MTPFAPFGSSTGTAVILPFAPNWGQSVDETLVWRMAATSTQAGAEQRRSLRVEPRLRLEFESLLTGADVALCESILTGWGNRDFAVPLWHGATRLTNASTLRQIVLRDSPDTLFTPGGWALLWRSSREFEAVRVDSIAGIVVGLLTPLAREWPAGTAVVPLQAMQLQDSQSVAAATAGVTRVSWSFEQTPGDTPAPPAQQSTVWTEVFPTDADAGNPRNHYLAYRHNWAESPQISVVTNADVFDPGAGLLSRRLTKDITSNSWAIDVLTKSRAQTALLRKFLLLHRGPGLSFWAPSPLADLPITGGISGVTVPVTDHGQATLPYALRNGVEIIGDSGVAREKVSIITPTALALARAVTVAGVRRSRWVSACRIAVDAITISHQTNGVARVRVPVVSVIDPSLYDSDGLAGGQGAYAGGGSPPAVTVQFSAATYQSTSTSGFALLRLARASNEPVVVTVTFDTGATRTVAFAPGSVAQGLLVSPAVRSPGTLITITAATGAAIGSLSAARVIGSEALQTISLLQFDSFPIVDAVSGTSALTYSYRPNTINAISLLSGGLSSVAIAGTSFDVFATTTSTFNEEVGIEISPSQTNRVFIEAGFTSEYFIRIDKPNVDFENVTRSILTAYSAPYSYSRGYGPGLKPPADGAFYFAFKGLAGPSSVTMKMSAAFLLTYLQNNPSVDIESDPFIFPIGSWVHVAFVFGPTGTSGYLNGVRKIHDSRPYQLTGLSPGKNLVKSGYYVDPSYPNLTRLLPGDVLIDSMRLTAGEVYTGESFTPPVGPLPQITV